MELYQKQSLAQSLRVYCDKRMASIFLLGIISGFPWVMIGSALSLWLKEDNLSRSTIGWAGLIFGVYAINFLWAPIIDRIRIPYLTKTLNHRRAWIFCMQGIIMLALLGWSLVDPTEQLWLVIGLGLVIAIASATQDITIDALRIEKVAQYEGALMQAGAAMTVMGWWTGFKIGGLITLAIADHIQHLGITQYWQSTFIIMTMFILACTMGLMLIHEPSANSRERAQQLAEKEIAKQTHLPKTYATITASIIGTVVEPITGFFKRNGVGIACGIIGFVFLFKIGEAFLGRMSLVFYKEIGFNKTDIALYSKGLGWITTIVFTMLGGLFAIRSGVIKAMFLSGILMSVTNVFFAVLYWSGKSKLLFALAVVSDDMTSAFATVAFVAFISMLVDRRYTATQYALLASLGTAGRTLLSSSSGALVDRLNGDWGTFFIITALMIIPSLLCLWYIQNKLTFSEHHAPEHTTETQSTNPNPEAIPQPAQENIDKET